MNDGEPVELWLTGKQARVYPYGVRTATEEWYHDGYAGYLSGQGFKILLFALLTLPLFGIGLFMLPGAVSYFVAASTFAARRTRSSFEKGKRSGRPQK